MEKLNSIRLIVFDADDTLWENQVHYMNIERRFCKLFPNHNEKEISETLYNIETSNMQSLGYGSKAYTISLIETALKLNANIIETKLIKNIISLGKELITKKIVPFPNVHSTLLKLKSAKFKLALLTTGEPLEQYIKLQQSELENLFDIVEIVPYKTENQYRKLCTLIGVNANQMLMVGNSTRNDIQPALAIGAWAVHIPYKLTWQYEQIEIADNTHFIVLQNIKELLNILNLK